MNQPINQSINQSITQSSIRDPRSDEVPCSIITSAPRTASPELYCRGSSDMKHSLSVRKTAHLGYPDRGLGDEPCDGQAWAPSRCLLGAQWPRCIWLS